MLVKKYVVTNSYTAKFSHSYIQWLITLLSSTMFLGYGFQIGWVSPMKKVLLSESSPTSSALTDIQMSIVAGTATLAAVPGTPLFLYISELYGRKISILILMSVHALSWIIKLSVSNIAVLIIARICSGLVLGGCYGVIPMYIREISQDSLRGTLLSLAMSFQHVGVFAMYTMGSYLGYYTTSWIVLTISIAALLLMLLAPESPVFLVKKGEFDVATRTLASLRRLKTDDINIRNEIDYMKNEDLYYKTVEKITFVTIFKNKAWRRVYILCQILTACIAFNGTFGIVTYAWSILTQAGVTFSPDLLSLIVPCLMMISAIVPMVFVERMGRRPLLAGTFILSATSLACLASALLAQRCGVSVASWVHVVSIALTVSAYSAGVLPLPTVIMADILKFQVRAKLMGCIQMGVYGVVSIQVMFFELASNAVGMHSVFYVFAGVNLFGALVVLTYVPETKGRTIEEIEAILAGQKNERAANDNSYTLPNEKT